MRTCARSLESREKTHYDLMEIRSEARGGECMRDSNKAIADATYRHGRKIQWRTIAARSQDMRKRIAATEARDAQSWMEKFHPLSNSAHNIVALMRIRTFELSGAPPCSNPCRPSHRPSGMTVRWNEEAYQRMRCPPQSIRAPEMLVASS